MFENDCLRSLYGASRANRIRMDEIRRALGIPSTIIDIVKKKRLKWYGHVVRKTNVSYVKKIYNNDFEGSRPRGRPPKKWKDQIRVDTNLPLLTVERMAKNRVKWKGSVEKFMRGSIGLCR